MSVVKIDCWVQWIRPREFLFRRRSGLRHPPCLEGGCWSVGVSFDGSECHGAPGSVRTWSITVRFLRFGVHWHRTNCHGKSPSHRPSNPNPEPESVIVSELANLHAELVTV